MKDSLRAHLDASAERLADLEQQLAAPDVTADQTRYRSLAKAQARLAPTVARYREWCRYTAEIDGLTELAADAELGAMAREDQNRLTAARAALESELLAALIPEDPADDGDAFLEIRAGTGGNEAALFVGDLFRMYERFAANQGWTIETLLHNAGEHGGFRSIVAHIDGPGVFGALRFESGTHRVQRIPRTEAQGRVHTSAATVAVLASDSDAETAIAIRPDDLSIDTFRASGAGGQHVNKTDSAVRITHLPSGIVVECQDNRSQHRNRDQAMALLHARLLAAAQAERQAEQAALRRDLIGSGDRSERIRTYNFPQSRVTDHRINLTVHDLTTLLEGGLDVLIGPLRTEYRAQLLADIEADD